MSWSEITLGEAIHVKHGYAFKSEFFSSKGDYIVLTPGNFHERGGFRVRPDKDRAYWGDIPEAYILDEGDLIVAMTEQGAGLLGSSALVPQSNRYLHNQRLGLVDKIDSSLLEKKFLYLLFNSRSVRAQINASASGTKVRHTAPERIYQVRVRVPDIRIQRKISDLALTYDELIENNHRRIQLLEETARLLYREWFVYLRFPGHEHVTITNGVPDGWEQTSLGQYSKLNYGKALKAENRVEGNFAVYGSSGIVGSHNAGLVKGPAIIVGRKGNVGSVYWSSRDCWPIDTVYFIDTDKANLYLYYALQFMQFISTDVAVPGLNRDLAHSRPLMIPSSRILSEFLLTAAPIRQQIEKLEELNQKLAQARDLLLPRLMNGEITV
ncbi:restriction endonuclease subunit S [Pseudomonas soli]|uniref:restriction endonuclease subunit S n=1 Tax=Pseudomonas soli TaxID=1306993 RepID=UPI00299EE862|nr:restriction endonuclease subunit S [Pseudomonas soli]MDW9401820.1 restriction endonuclease subunit S [Pseudomonas soli]